mmetsp:Transcript_26963/g.23847  ORF Transcript_26963/g.23847 Transcript_26963/m.23847 type:complete len:80 (+) Transcript_26963:258-497(+)
MRHKWISPEYLDSGGYNAIHHAVSYNSIQMTIILLDYFKVPVDFRSSSGQTPLMVACNYGHTEIIAHLCQREADVNAQD